MATFRNPIIGGVHALTIAQHADLGEALQWHSMYILKLMTGAENDDGVTYQDAAGYCDDALRRAGMPPMGALNEALTARRDAALNAKHRGEA